MSEVIIRPEIWKPIFVGYLISDCGGFKSYWRARALRMDLPPKLRKVKFNRGCNRNTIELKDGKTYKTYSVSVLVKITFGSPRPEGMECCHENGISTDDRIENLRWDTPVGNAADKLKHGTDIRGTKHPLSILTEDDVRAIRRMANEGYLHDFIAKTFGMCRSNVSQIIHRKRWGWLT